MVVSDEDRDDYKLDLAIQVLKVKGFRGENQLGIVTEIISGFELRPFASLRFKFFNR